MLRALQGARRLLKLVYQFFYRFFLLLQAAAADATAQTAPEVSANNPATMLLSLGQFWATRSLRFDTM